MGQLLKIQQIREETDRVRVIDLAPVEGAACVAPGAHLTFDLGPLGTRAYSVIQWPDATSTYKVAVQLEPDGAGGSRAMHHLDVGDTVSVDGPKNSFPLDDGTGPAVLLAGGIGVTPLISMASTLLRAGRAFTFHYAGRSRRAMAFVDRLEATFGAAMRIWCDDTNPLDLAEAVRTPLGAHIYICGPRGMIDAARKAAETVGVPNAQIHVELFENESSAPGDTPFEVEIAETGAVYSVGADQTIIEALEAAGLDLVYDCQRGDCGICQTDVVAGTPDHRDVVLSQAERDSGTVMQICVSRSKSPRLVLDL